MWVRIQCTWRVSSLQTENMFLRSHLILICHRERSQAAAPRCPLANSAQLWVLVFISLSLYPSAPCSLLTRDRSTITHPTVKQLKASYLPEEGNNDARFVFANASPFKWLHLKVSAALTVFQQLRWSRTCCPSAASQSKLPVFHCLLKAEKVTHVDILVLFHPPSLPPLSSLTGASATFMPIAVYMKKRSWVVNVNTTPPGPTVAAVRGTTRGVRGVLAPTCPSPRAQLISVSRPAVANYCAFDGFYPDKIKTAPWRRGFSCWSQSLNILKML